MTSASKAPAIEVTTVNIGAPDPGALARFYRDLLGWKISTEEPHWVVLRHPQGGLSLAFQTEASYLRPIWPPAQGEQQMMIHLEIRVDALADGVDHAVSCGAVVADHQAQDDVRVCFNPAGHPFCLWGGLTRPSAPRSRPLSRVSAVIGNHLPASVSNTCSHTAGRVPCGFSASTLA